MQTTVHLIALSREDKGAVPMAVPNSQLSFYDEEGPGTALISSVCGTDDAGHITDTDPFTAAL